VTKLDYCNTALASLPSCDLDRLQSVINAATRLTVGEQRHDHITLLLANLHWLHIPQCIQYKLRVLVYQCVQGSASSYLQNAICPVVSDYLSVVNKKKYSKDTFNVNGTRTKSNKNNVNKNLILTIYPSVL